MRPFEPIHFLGAYPLHQLYAVIHDVSRLVVVAGGALLPDIERLEAKLGVRSYGAVVPGVVLALVVATAAHAGQCGVAQADPLVERLLCLAHVVGPGLDALPGCPDLPALALVDSLARPLLVLWRVEDGAGRTAYGLSQALRHE